MKELLTIFEQDINPDAHRVDRSNFGVREAARGVVMDKDGNIHLLHVANRNFYKLPGGGIDTGETQEDAMKRECLEEIGCHIEIIAELGTITEYRDQFELVQTSYCYLANQIGEQMESALEESEIAEGFEEIKVADIHDAIEIIKKSQPTNYEGRFIQKRDLAILKAAQDIL